jgi:hypothetical protein
LTAALLTKPQVAPLLAPFGAWFLARSGFFTGVGVGAGKSAGVGKSAGGRVAALVHLARLGLVAAVTAVVLWLPFLAAGGPAHYLAALATYQSDVYSVLSLNAWNLWWLFQTVLADGALVGDNQGLIGPVTFRVAGYVLTAVLLLAVAAGVWRRPTADGLALGVAAAALAAFSFLTTMHERYAYAAVIFLVLLVERPVMRWLGLVLGVVFSLNLVASATVHDPVPILELGGINGIVGSLLMIGVTLALVMTLLRRANPGSRLGRRRARRGRRGARRGRWGAAARRRRIERGVTGPVDVVARGVDRDHARCRASDAVRMRRQLELRSRWVRSVA